MRTIFALFIFALISIAAIEAFKPTHIEPSQEQVQHIADSVRTAIEWEQLQEQKAELERLYPD